MRFDDNLKKYQNYLKENAVDFAVVFSNDEFLKECSDLSHNSRYLLSGFTGTAGDMLITQNKAFLFVDGRYHIQVDEQTNPKYITPVKLKMGETRNEKIFEIIKKAKIKNPKILLPSNKISETAFEKLNTALSVLNPNFQKTEEDLVCKFFVTKSAQKVYKVWEAGIKQVGKSVADKLKGLRKYENDFLLVFTSDEICYLANIRANQNAFSSSLNAFGLVGDRCVRIFCDLKNIPEDLKSASENVVFIDFNDFDKFIKDKKRTIFYEPDKTPLLFADKFKKGHFLLKKLKFAPVAKMKAKKNKIELNYIKECYKKSDIALLQAINYLQKQIADNKQITAGEFINKLWSFEKAQGVIDLSFNPIFAVNERSAIIHCTEFNPNQVLNKGDLILLDYGVYFDGGYATDMTRTFVLGDVCENQLYKEVYTTVLRAFLNALNYKITKETMYFDLDKKARSIIKKAKTEGFNFNHGTGHGIGLNVHEMPPVVSPSKLAKQKLMANTVFSIEPGMYKENVGGVRIENSVCTVKTKNGIKIETLTRLPFDEKLIMLDMLTKKEQKWLREYQDKALK